MTTKAKHPVRTTETTLTIVEELNELGWAGVTELADRTGIGKSAVHNHLNTLREHGYVTKVDDEYRLALKFLDVGGRARSRHKLYRTARSTIEKLEIEMKGIFRLLTQENGKGIILYQSERGQARTDKSYTGQRPYLHCTAGGKAILAELPRERVDEILEQHGLPEVTKNTITDRERLFDELEQARESGYTVEEEEWVIGVSCIGTTITDEDGFVLGAISIVKPLTEVGAATFDTADTEKLLRQAVETIETNIEYSWYKPNKFIKMKHR